MTHAPEYVPGITTHARRGGIANAFRYRVDYVLIDPEARGGPFLFSRNRWNLASVHDRSHGGPVRRGRGVAWARETFRRAGLEAGRILLLTQPRFLGAVFNPVSFWLAVDGAGVIAIIAEVSTPFGDRHCYLCHLPSFAPITRSDRIEAPKALHVSPYQDVAGDYGFNFDIRPDRVAIRILYRNGDEGVIATLTGPRRPLTDGAILRAALRRPLGSVRTLILIYWQALVLRLKGARYRTRPEPPPHEVT